MHPEKGLWRQDAQKLQILDQRREMLFSSNADVLERIYWLMEDAKRYGTLPFAGLARAGFVAVQLLQSLVNVGVLQDKDYSAFMNGLSTVSGQLSHDMAILDKTTFLSRYGHLRPGTYDILSPRYDEQPELYFDWNSRPPPNKSPVLFSLTLEQMRQTVKLLESHGLHPDAVGLFDFLQSGIELREQGKFHFTRNVSDILALIGQYGEQLGFSREDLSFCEIQAFTELHISSANPKEVLQHCIEQGKARYAETLKTSLPPLIVNPDDIWSFRCPESSPNYITQNKATAPVVSHEQRDKLTGAIVCIPSADPGFDWLFACPIAGLITAWGGANSHMAIRAGELGLPAVIGAGEILYKRWSNARKLLIDCANKHVEILS